MGSIWVGVHRHHGLALVAKIQQLQGEHLHRKQMLEERIPHMETAVNGARPSSSRGLLVAPRAAGMALPTFTKATSALGTGRHFQSLASPSHPNALGSHGHTGQGGSCFCPHALSPLLPAALFPSCPIAPFLCLLCPMPITLMPCVLQHPKTSSPCPTKPVTTSSWLPHPSTPLPRPVLCFFVQAKALRQGLGTVGMEKIWHKAASSSRARLGREKQ